MKTTLEMAQELVTIIGGTIRTSEHEKPDDQHTVIDNNVEHWTMSLNARWPGKGRLAIDTWHKPKAGLKTQSGNDKAPSITLAMERASDTATLVKAVQSRVMPDLRAICVARDAQAKEQKTNEDSTSDAAERLKRIVGDTMAASQWREPRAHINHCGNYGDFKPNYGGKSVRIDLSCSMEIAVKIAELLAKQNNRNNQE